MKICKEYLVVLYLPLHIPFFFFLSKIEYKVICTHCSITEDGKLFYYINEYYVIENDTKNMRGAAPRNFKRRGETGQNKKKKCDIGPGKKYA